MLANHPKGQAPIIEKSTMKSSVLSIRFLKMPFHTNSNTDPIKIKLDTKLKACILHQKTTDIVPLTK